MRRFLLSLLLFHLFLSGVAHGQALHLDPLVRVHGGASVVTGPSPVGLEVGMDSRLTRLLMVDLGGFYTPGGLQGWEPPADPEDTDWFHLRHGIYVDPGVRVPHSQPRAFTWEAVVRVGVGVAFLADLTPSSPLVTTLEVDPAAVAAANGGLDLLIQREKLGVRLLFRQYSYSSYSDMAGRSLWDTASRFGVEAFYQFGGDR